MQQLLLKKPTSAYDDAIKACGPNYPDWTQLILRSNDGITAEDPAQQHLVDPSSPQGSWVDYRVDRLEKHAQARHPQLHRTVVRGRTGSEYELGFGRGRGGGGEGAGRGPGGLFEIAVPVEAASGTTQSVVLLNRVVLHVTHTSKPRQLQVEEPFLQVLQVA